MPKSISSSSTGPREDIPARTAKPATATEKLVAQLAKARTANEITNVIGLKPIKGRSGPKIAY